MIADLEEEEMEVEGGACDSTTQKPALTIDLEAREMEVKGSAVDVVTQEPIAEMEQLHPREAITPLVFSACERTQGTDEGWCSVRILLIQEVQKWKQQELSLQEGAILLKEHKKLMDSLWEKWLKKNLAKEWEEQRSK